MLPQGWRQNEKANGGIEETSPASVKEITVKEPSPVKSDKEEVKSVHRISEVEFVPPEEEVAEVAPIEESGNPYDDSFNENFMKAEKEQEVEVQIEETPEQVEKPKAATEEEEHERDHQSQEEKSESENEQNVTVESILLDENPFLNPDANKSIGRISIDKSFKQ